MLSSFRMSSSHSGRTSRNASAMRIAAGNWKWAWPSTSSSRSQPTASRIALSGRSASSIAVLEISPGVRHRRAIEGPHLQRRVPQPGQLGGQLRRLVKHAPAIAPRAGPADRPHAGPSVAAPAGTVAGAAVVDPHPLAHRPAQQTVHRLPGRLTEYVPQGQVDRRQRAQLRAAHAEVGGPLVQEPPVALDGQRVGPQQAVAEPVVDHRRHRLRDVVALAAPYQSLVGMDPAQQQPGEQVLGQTGLDPGDPQRRVGDRHGGQVACAHCSRGLLRSSSRHCVTPLPVTLYANVFMRRSAGERFGADPCTIRALKNTPSPGSISTATASSLSR